MKTFPFPLRAIISWIMVLWISKVFLVSLTYKFRRAPETEYIFGTIGEWTKGILGEPIGNLFAQYGGYATGVAELFVSVLFLLPAFLWLGAKIRGKGTSCRGFFHGIGGLMATGIMAGAVFFHLVTPLGIEVNSDGGSLFYAGVMILVLGLVLFGLHKKDVIRVLKRA